MITDKDIIKLQAVFATKEDLKGFATKEDLKGLATKEDLRLLATREELADLRLDVGEIKDELGAVKEDIAEIKNTMHGLAGSVDNLWMENRAGWIATARHTRQIETLAQHTGVTLPE